MMDARFAPAASGVGTPMLRVVLVAAVRLYCDGLAAVLATQEGIEVVGRAKDWRTAVPLVAELSPDVVLVDLPSTEDRAAVRQLADASPATTRVVAISVGDFDSDVVSWAEAGVAGFVTREDSLDDLVEVVRAVTRDELPCSPRVAAALLRRVAMLAADRSPVPVRLTSRELEIVTLIERGLSNKEISRDLSIQLATVKNHVHNILEKLQVTRRSDAVARVRGRAVHPELSGRP
jgi:DNA-binding NarL/FixJ family response regulator